MRRRLGGSASPSGAGVRAEARGGSGAREKRANEGCGDSERSELKCETHQHARVYSRASITVVCTL